MEKKTALLLGHMFIALAFIFLAHFSVQAQTTLYGVIGSDLVTVNTATGDATFLGSLGAAGAGINELEYHPGVNKMLAIANGATNPQLVEVNLTTGAATLIGDIDITSPGFINMGAAEGLAYNPTDGLLYASAETSTPYSRRLLVVDPNTGNATQIATTPFGCAGNGNGDLDALEFVGNTLYSVDVCPPPSYLYTINTTTGVSTFVGAIGSAFQNVNDIAYDENTGIMYAMGTPTRTLITVNLTNGTGSLVGTTHSSTEFGGATMTALSFGPGSTAPVPTLSQWGLIFFGLTILCIGAIALRRQSRQTKIVTT